MVTYVDNDNACKDDNKKMTTVMGDNVDSYHYNDKHDHDDYSYYKDDGKTTITVYICALNIHNQYLHRTQ